MSPRPLIPLLFFVSIIALAFGAGRISRASVHVFGLFFPSEKNSVSLPKQEGTSEFQSAALNEATRSSSEIVREKEYVRMIRYATIADHIPPEGKCVVVDMTENKILTFQDARLIGEYLMEHRPATTTFSAIASRAASDLAPLSGDAKDTVTGGEGLLLPPGMSTILEKKEETIGEGGVMLPWYVAMNKTCAVHGAPRTRTFEKSIIGEDTPASSCILLSNKQAKAFFAFAEPHTPLYVYDGSEQITYDVPRLAVDRAHTPKVGAKSFVIADMVTGDVYLEKRADTRLPIASVTKLMTAAIADDVFAPDRAIYVSARGKEYAARDLLYPLFLRSDNRVAESLAAAYNTKEFIERMNTKARFLGMRATSFEDASGVSANNRSTALDLLTFGLYLYEKKEHLLALSAEDRAEIRSTKGVRWSMANQNRFAPDSSFLGGKLGFTDAARQTALSVFRVRINNEPRVIGIVILGADDWKSDTRTLLSWFAHSAAPRTEFLAASPNPKYLTDSVRP